MKIERTKNAQRNIIAGIGFKLVSMLGPFIMRTVLLYTMGVQYLGLNSLFTSIVQTFLQISISICAAYALTKLHFPGKNFTYRFIQSSMFVPAVVTIIPTFFIISAMLSSTRD